MANVLETRVINTLDKAIRSDDDSAIRIATEHERMAKHVFIEPVPSQRDGDAMKCYDGDASVEYARFHTMDCNESDGTCRSIARQNDPEYHAGMHLPSECTSACWTRGYHS